MKRIYYSAGPPNITAGIAGPFNVGKAKPVSDKTAALLLARPEFSEAGPDVPDDEAQDIAALTAAALADDETAMKEFKAAKKNQTKTEEVANG